MESRPPGNFTCSICAEKFTRLDHLSRHIRSHNAQRPFICSICNKSFTRGDSLSRHCRNHRPDSNSSNTRSILNRVPRACEACAKSKLRCDGAQICGRCKEKNNTCVYLRKVRTRVDRRRLDKRVEKNHDNDVNDGGENKPPEDMGHMLTEAAKTDTMDMDIHTLELLSQAAFQVATPSPTLDPTGIRQEDTAPKVGYTSLDIESPLPGGSSTSQGVSAGWSTIDSLNPMFDCTEPGVGDEMSPAGFQEFGLEMSDFNASWNQNFDIADWTTLESPYNDIQASYISMGTSPPNSAQPSWVAPMGITEQTLLVHSENFQIDPSLQQEAPNVNFDTTSLETRSRGEHRVIDGVIPRETHHFSHSQPAREQKQGREGNYDGNSTDVGQWPTDWNPRKADNVISFPDMSGTARDVFEAENFAHVEKLSQNTYNSILNCVLQTSKEQKLFRLFRESTLPSLEAFDCFVQLYFEYFQPIMPLIHQATFNPAKASWVLVLAVASIGCRYSKAQGSGKCATALAELCRRAIMLTCESDNSCVRELWLTQAIVLNITAMMYSGDKRLLEIGLASRSGMVTQCRRNNALNQASQYVSLDESTNDHLLDARWEKWRREESYRRLGFCTWILECQLPLFFNTNCSMGINELQQDLPCQEAVWEAPNARTWKRLYLQYRGKSYPPTFHAALQDLRLGKPISNATGNFGKLVLAYAVYLTAWELQSRDSNPLLGPASEIACWKMVASSVLEALQPDLTSKSDSSGMDLMLQGFIDNVHLILHAPLADLLDLARSQINNRKNAAEVRQRLLHWIQEDDGRTARRAVLHASVLFSLVRRKSCHGFHEPFALLFSTLTIWAFIHLNSTLSSLNSSTDGERQQTIRLDKIRDERGIHDWVEYGSRLRGHLTDVGNICGPGAGQRLLQVSCQSLLSMEVWTLSKGFANVLSSLKGRRVD